MNEIRYCKCLPPTNILESYSVAINERPSNASNLKHEPHTFGVGIYTKFWRPGRTLKVLVFKYNEHSFEAVKNGAMKWSPYINLKFEFLEMDEEDVFESEEFLGDIRVDFQPSFDNGGSSRIGTDALTGHPHTPSMHLGTNFSSPYFEWTIIHEFGHALGLHHEHQHPDANIPWDREKTYDYYARRGLSREDVDSNVLPLKRMPDAIYSPYDRQSIMHYEVPNELTIGDWQQAANLHISERDISIMYSAYP
jgi:hypothetical protein